MRNRFLTTLFATLSIMSANAQQDSVMVSTQPDTVPATTIPQDSIPRKRMRVDGFRVQVYYGGNNHKSKLQAKRMADRARIWFDDHKVYTSFTSPHWICRVGDFQTREEAMELLTAMRESGRFPMAVIVKCKVTVYVNENDRTEHPDSCATGDTATCVPNPGTIGGGTE